MDRRAAGGDHDPALIITSGDLPGFLACWAEGVCRAPSPATTASSGSPARANSSPAAPAAPVAWVHPDANDHARASALACLDACHLAAALTGRFALPDDALERAPAHRIPALLLAAGLEAQARGLHRVVWPLAIGPALAERVAEADRLARLADAMDAALLASRLLAVGGPSLRVTLPYVEFSDAQLLDLAVDLDAPVPASAVCDHATPPQPVDRGALVASADPGAPCGHCVSCQRWARAAEIAGLRLRDVLVPGAALAGV